MSWLFELRSIGDYGVIEHVTQTEAERATEAAAKFLSAIKELLVK
ncbi:MAG: hypothetical protein AAB209_14070 [Bacteroidota bacterium]